MAALYGWGMRHKKTFELCLNPKNNLVTNTHFYKMKNLCSLIIISIIIVSGCNNSQQKNAADKEEYQKAQETLLEKEAKNPVNFLKVNSKEKHNLLGQTVIKGTIMSIAKICVYSDIAIELSFFSKTGKLLEKDNETIYETIDPGISVDFKTKYFAPKGTDSVVIKVVSANTK